MYEMCFTCRHTAVDVHQPRAQTRFSTQLTSLNQQSTNSRSPARRLDVGTHRCLRLLTDCYLARVDEQLLRSVYVCKLQWRSELDFGRPRRQDVVASKLVTSSFLLQITNRCNYHNYYHIYYLKYPSNRFCWAQL